MATDEPASNYYTMLKFAPGEATVITELASELGQPPADAVLIAVRQTLPQRRQRERN